jgi:hypothetical protein
MGAGIDGRDISRFLILGILGREENAPAAIAVL